jgi:VCBS repeat-containing protein
MQDVTVRRRSVINGASGFDTLNREGNRGKLKFRNYEDVNNTVQSPAPVPPVAANDTATVTRGGSTTINVAANDTSATSTLDLSSIVITQAPANGTAVANTDGTVTYTNNGAIATSDSFEYTIKDQDGTTSNTATVSITVNAPLAAIADSGSVTEDATPNTATGNVLDNDTGGTGTKTVTAVNGSAAKVGANVAGSNAFGTFNIAANGTFTYTLDNSNTTVNALNAGQTLTDTITYTVTAGSETSTATLTITIQGATDAAPLVAVADSGSVTEDTSPNTATGDVLANDTGGAGTKTVTAVNGSGTSVGTDVQRSFGAFNIAANGQFTYTLDNTNTQVNGLNAGEALTDTITYDVTAGSETATATLTITIQGNTDP